jgi:hypothetical protein
MVKRNPSFRVLVARSAIVHMGIYQKLSEFFTAFIFTAKLDIIMQTKV